jgi:hypothetical protein
MGTSPLHVAYGVDLPAALLAEADIRWLDNGVYLGDEPKGDTYLEAPGFHNISVLIVTRDGTEYRGQAQVQVLEKGTRSETGTRRAG